LIGIIVPMGWLQAILLGLLQGLTEFLPVSSTAHMAIVPQLFGQKDPGAAFSAIAQLGPIIAIILYFRSDLMRYIQGILRTRLPNRVPADDVDARLGWYTLFGSLPIMVFGFLLEKRIDREFRSLYVVAASMIVLAIILLIAEKVGKRTVTLDKMTLGQSQGVGWAQVLGLIPGASRSGSTITAGLLLGLDRESAARFSFLLGIPAITAAGLYKLYREMKHGNIGSDVAPDLLAMVVAGVFAYIVVRWFMGYMKEHNTGIFIGYRIAFGVILLILLGTGRLKNQLPKPDEATEKAVTSRPTLISARFTSFTFSDLPGVGAGLKSSPGEDEKSAFADCLWCTSSSSNSIHIANDHRFCPLKVREGGHGFVTSRGLQSHGALRRPQLAQTKTGIEPVQWRSPN